MKLGTYEHYKGKKYRVIGVARHSETLEEYVYYECLHENDTSQFWVRPLAMFNEHVVVDGKRIPRFKYIGD